MVYTLLYYRSLSLRLSEAKSCFLWPTIITGFLVILESILFSKKMYGEFSYVSFRNT